MTRTAQAPIMEAVLDDAAHQLEASNQTVVIPVVKEFIGNLFALHGTMTNKVGTKDEMIPVWIAFLTNGMVKQDGEAVMGVGMARLLKDKYPTLPGVLGKIIQGGRNNVTVFRKSAMMAFPHQMHWRNPPVESLILQSAHQLMVALNGTDTHPGIPEVTADRPIFVERPGYHMSDPTKSVPWGTLSKKLALIVDDRVVFVLPERSGPREAVMEADL
jgi:hypothetical protein